MVLPLAVALTSLSLVSCVGKKKFLYEVSTRDSMVMQLNSRVIELNQEIARHKLQFAEKTGENTVLRELQDKQDKQIDRLENEIEKLTNQSLSQQQLMDMTLKRKQEEISEKEQVLETMHQTLENQEKTMKDLLGNIQSALLSYDQNELSLEVREGKAYIGISEKLLFKPGSTQLTRDAMDILEKVAGVLTNHPEVDIAVEGHTDNIPVKSREFKDNWDLSAMRATTIVRILTREFYLNPSQTAASGRGEYLPKTSNETADGRAMNRRMEIILSSKLDKIFKMIQENPKGRH